MSGDVKKLYDVEITETLQRTITVEAASQLEAEEAVEEAWNRGDYVLNAEDFVDASFRAIAERELQKPVHRKSVGRKL